MAAAALAAYVPQFSIISVSTSQRISSMFSERVLGYLRDLPGLTERLDKDNQEMITIMPGTRAEWDQVRVACVCFSGQSLTRVVALLELLGDPHAALQPRHAARSLGRLLPAGRGGLRQLGAGDAVHPPSDSG